MTENQEELSPEEKLLKVIQSGGEQAGSGEDAAAAGEENAPPRLQLKKQAPAPPESEGADAAGLPEPGGLIGAGVPDYFERKPAGGAPVGITLVNRCLAGVVVVMLLFAVYEILANIQTVDRYGPEPAGEWEAPELSAAGGDIVLPTLENVLASFRERPIFQRPVNAAEDGVTETRQVRVPNWEAYTRENLNLIGTSRLGGADSGREAILVDKRADRMYFLREGDTVVVDERTLEMKRIETDSVILTDGSKEITLE
ncbi:MAG: hypothetical protein JW951_07505 [Lentisphaerae bacterium]|nr:hypothetical protein [Lentisphaerota bacterium]